MTMSWSFDKTEYEKKNLEPSQTIFLATRMDLMAQIQPKREKAKKPLMTIKRALSLNGYKQKSTSH
jgi:hypothetical protein